VLLGKINNEQKTRKLSADISHYPFEVPESWVWCRLGDINNIARGGSPRPIKDFLTDSEDGINWIKIGDTEKGGKYIYATQEKIIRNGMKHSRFVNVDDFLLTNSMSFGRPYILKTNGCIHDGWLVISIEKRLLDVDFIYYLLSSEFMYNQFSNTAVGSTVKNLKTETVQRIPFPIPPLTEQKRIVQKIESIFQTLDSIQNNL
jgi:type I restriction enzyme S subunit